MLLDILVWTTVWITGPLLGFWIALKVYPGKNYLTIKLTMYPGNNEPIKTYQWPWTAILGAILLVGTLFWKPRVGYLSEPLNMWLYLIGLALLIHKMIGTFLLAAACTWSAPMGDRIFAHLQPLLEAETSSHVDLWVRFGRYNFWTESPAFRQWMLQQSDLQTCVDLKLTDGTNPTPLFWALVQEEYPEWAAYLLEEAETNLLDNLSQQQGQALLLTDHPTLRQAGLRVLGRKRKTP